MTITKQVTFIAKKRQYRTIKRTFNDNGRGFKS